MIPSGLSGFLEEIQTIAADADRDRLLNLYPVFAAQYPDLAAKIERAVNAPNAGEALEILCQEYPVFRVFLRCASPDWSARIVTSLHYLHATLHGRIKDGQLQQ